MPTELPVVDELLDPIPVAGMPAGIDMRWTPEWDRLKEARRFDDSLETGKWQKRERKIADWRTVRELAASMLRGHTKDLQIAMWLTEANVKLDGFKGLSVGLKLTRELMDRYWGQGLFPSMEDGPEDRSGPFEWLNRKLVDSIREIPITVRNDEGRDYAIIDLEDARRVGSEKSYRSEDGEIDPVRKRAYEQALTDGHISLEMFEAAVSKSDRAAFEELASDFRVAWEEFQALEKSVDEHFGDVAPNLALGRNAMDSIRQAISDILEERRKASPDPTAAVSGVLPGTETAGARAEGEKPPSITMRFNLPIPAGQDVQPSPGHSWEDAENLIRTGQVEKGLAEMMTLAATETTGRSRFLRKLMLAQACLDTQREKLARTILEELAEQIDKFQLEHWESSELVAGVWARICRLYSKTDDADLTDAGRKYYQRLCRLDPWQALKCGEV